MRNEDDMDTKVEQRKESKGVELPKYKCHKIVWAVKIKEIELDFVKAREENRETDGSGTITPMEEGYAPFKVNHEYMREHNPGVGGYFVLYAGGYKSYSPAKAFEEEYTRI